MKYIIFLLILFFGFGVCFGEYQIIDIDQYKLLKNKTKNLNFEKTLTNKEVSCKYTKVGNNYVIEPICIINNDFPNLQFKDAVDIILPYINSFDKIYQLDKTGFSYDYSTPNLSFNSLKVIFSGDAELLNYLQSKNIFISLHERYFAELLIKNYSFFVTSKDLTNREDCRKKNYFVGISILDKKIINPSEKYNFNKDLIKNYSYYCKKGGGNYLFNGGVCGASTLLFRNALLNPYLYITKRFNHSERLTKYYSDYLYGDDSSVYENIKQLEIINTGNHQIYFRSLNKGNISYLISVIPSKHELISLIKKENIKKLSSIVGKTILNKNGQIRYEQYWLSNYSKKKYQ